MLLAESREPRVVLLIEALEVRDTRISEPRPVEPFGEVHDGAGGRQQKQRRTEGEDQRPRARRVGRDGLVFHEPVQHDAQGLADLERGGQGKGQGGVGKEGRQHQAL